MKYINIYENENWLEIEYNTSEKCYFGRKVIKGELKGMATGIEWGTFFSNFTGLGLAYGEGCKFE